MEVVLPAPLTPLIITTSGWARSRSSGRSSGASSLATSSANARFNASASVMFSMRARSHSFSIKLCAASTPQSAAISADSSWLNRASSTLTPVKMPVNCARVFASPAFRRSLQDDAGGGVTAGGVAGAFPDMPETVGGSASSAFFVLKMENMEPVAAFALKASA